MSWSAPTQRGMAENETISMRTIVTAHFPTFLGVAGLDFPDDSRSFALADFDRDGRLEIVLKNRNAPQLRVLRLAMPEVGNSIAFRLRGSKSNRDAIGAAVTVTSGDLRQTKYLQAGSGFLSQHTKELFFGLGKSGVAAAQIRWPSGLMQSLDGLPVNHRIEIEEGAANFLAKPFATSPRSWASPGDAASSEALPSSVETWLIEPLAAPDFSLPDLDGNFQELRSFRSRFVLLNFWMTAAPSSREELRLLSRSNSVLASEGLRVITVNVDAAGDADAQERLSRRQVSRFPFF